MKRTVVAVLAVVLWLVVAVLWAVWAVVVVLVFRRKRTRRRLIPDFPNLARMIGWTPGPRRPVINVGRQRVQRTAREREALVAVLRRRDGDACQLCGYLLDFDVAQSHPDAEEVDHVVPFSRGGDCHVSNMQLAHRECNQSKGARWAPAG